MICPAQNDAHQDHRLLAEQAPTVFRDQLVLHYEIPKWDGDLARRSVYLPLTDEVARRKVELLHASSVAEEPGLVGRRGVPRAGAAAGYGVPLALRRGFPLLKAGDVGERSDHFRKN